MYSSQGDTNGTSAVAGETLYFCVLTDGGSVQSKNVGEIAASAVLHPPEPFKKALGQNYHVGGVCMLALFASLCVFAV